MYTSLVLAAWRGQESQARGLIETTIEEVRARGEGRVLSLAEYATTVLHNGLGHYEEALAAATRACQYEDLGFFGWTLAELIEAAARSGRPHGRRVGAGEAHRTHTPAEQSGHWAWRPAHARY